MIIKYSHNDEWCKRPIDDAMKAGCSMIEIDVIYDSGKVWASHSKRCFNFLYKGTVEDIYLKRISKNPDIMLYFDIKMDGSTIIDRLAHDLIRNHIKNKIYIGGAFANINILPKYYGDMLNVDLFSNLCDKNQVISSDVFGEKKWWMR